jgi:thiol-disulfide isomerase/thioredoxin
MKRVLCYLTILFVCGVAPIAQAKRAPNLELKSLSGATEKIADLRGSIVVINFWATWCGPCKEELPLLSKLTQEYSGKKVRFISISVDEPKNRQKIDQFLSQQKLSMEIWVGGDLDMLERAGLGNVVPGTMILDEQGEIITRIMGQAHEEDIKAPLDWLVGGKAGVAPPAAVKRY